MLQLVIFGVKFSKTIVIVEIRPQFYLIAKFRKKAKMSKFGNTNALFGCFWARILKNYCHIWNQHLQIFYLQNIYKKRKLPKFLTKSALSVYFWARILKNYCDTSNQHPAICMIAKFRKKITFGPKNLYWVFLNKNALFGYFRPRIKKKTIVIIEIRTLKIV